MITNASNVKAASQSLEELLKWILRLAVLNAAAWKLGVQLAVFLLAVPHQECLQQVELQKVNLDERFSLTGWSVCKEKYGMRMLAVY